jgi:hypothetical protein
MRTYRKCSFLQGVMGANAIALPLCMPHSNNHRNKVKKYINSQNP